MSCKNEHLLEKVVSLKEVFKAYIVNYLPTGTVIHVPQFYRFQFLSDIPIHSSLYSAHLSIVFWS